jgi:hypothetical protein
MSLKLMYRLMSIVKFKLSRRTVRTPPPFTSEPLTNNAKEKSEIDSSQCKVEPPHHQMKGQNLWTSLPVDLQLHILALSDPLTKYLNNDPSLHLAVKSGTSLSLTDGKTTSTPCLCSTALPTMEHYVAYHLTLNPSL